MSSHPPTLPAQEYEQETLMQPQAPYTDAYPPSPSFRDSTAALDKSEAGRDTPNAPFIASNEGNPAYGTKAADAGKRKRIVIGIVAVTVVALILAIILPIYFLVVKPKNQSLVSAGGSGGSTSGGGGGGSTGGGGVTPQPGSKVTGGDGSEVTMEDGTKFTYKNKFGGYWYYDPQDPVNQSARPQADIPALNTTWTFGKDVIQG